MPVDIDAIPLILENFALEWEADIRFNKMSDGSEPGPDVKIRPREQCDRITTERRIAFMRQVATEIAALRQQLAEARYWIYREEAPDFARHFETLDHVPEGEGKELLKRIDRALAAGREG